MTKIETGIPGVYIIEPKVFGDHRGYFMETYSAKAFAEMGIDTVFVQDNQSFSAQKGTLRGIHYQNAPYAQTKLVRVTKGSVLDVAVDLRKGSPTYKQWVAVELSAENKRMLYIPQGFGHAFCTLTDDVEFCYKVDNLYNPASEGGVRFDDPEIGVEWKLQNPVTSARDRDLPLLKDDTKCNFVYGEI